VARTSFAAADCPIARGADAVGDLWSLLILRDLFDGFTRFDELQTDLGIAPNILTRRLGALQAAGLIDRRRYLDSPPRDEYVLTARGRSFHPVVLALYAAGPAGLPPDQRHLQLRDRDTGAEVEPVLVDRATGRPLSELDLEFTAGAAAGPRMRTRLATLASRAARAG
jgi:DNA-binding HxlR family transcriptional regulator